MNDLYLCTYKLALIGLIVFLVSCGGGSGPSITYTGSRSQANIDVTNAKTLVEGGITGSQAGIALKAESNSQDSQSRLRILDVSRILSNSVNQVEIGSSFRSLAGKTVSESGSIGCSAGGITYNLSLDDVTGAFNGTFTYNNCTEGSTAISGTMNVSGTINLSSGLITQMTFSTNGITIISGSENFTMAGTISMSVSGNSSSMSMDVLFQDNATNFVVWIDNFSITATDNISYLEFSISGRFYHPDYGYVDIVTNQPIRFNYSDLYPYSGQITVSGANGSKARLTVIDSTQYTLEVDEDGDGTYETVTTENW